MIKSEGVFEEKKILLRLKSGDHDAFEIIYHTYKDKLIGNLLRILKDRDLVEEQVQELFYKIWTNKEKIGPEKPFKAYLFQIASNLATDVFRKMYYDRQMRAKLIPIEERIYNHIEDSITQSENHQILQLLLEQLPQQRKNVYTLCKIEGRSYKEVSEMLGISENTINDHIRKANNTLRSLVANRKLSVIILTIILCSSI